MRPDLQGKRVRPVSGSSVKGVSSALTVGVFSDGVDVKGVDDKAYR
jgi:hypothetical protein